MALVDQALLQFAKKLSGEQTDNIEITNIIGFLQGAAPVGTSAACSFTAAGGQQPNATMDADTTITVREGSKIDALLARQGSTYVDLVPIQTVEPTGSVVEIDVKITSWTITFSSS